jgi:hypothetical protein
MVLLNFLVNLSILSVVVTNPVLAVNFLFNFNILDTVVVNGMLAGSLIYCLNDDGTLVVIPVEAVVLYFIPSVWLVYPVRRFIRPVKLLDNLSILDTVVLNPILELNLVHVLNDDGTVVVKVDAPVVLYFTPIVDDCPNRVLIAPLNFLPSLSTLDTVLVRLDEPVNFKLTLVAALTVLTTPIFAGSLIYCLNDDGTLVVIPVAAVVLYLTPNVPDTVVSMGETVLNSLSVSWIVPTTPNVTPVFALNLVHVLMLDGTPSVIPIVDVNFFVIFVAPVTVLTNPILAGSL